MEVGLDLINQVFSIIVRPLRLSVNVEKFKKGVGLDSELNDILESIN